MSDSVTNTAVRLNQFGGREALTIETIAVPQPQDDEVLVRVAAASANPVDHKIREGKYPAYHEKDLPITLGRDLAGTIEAVGTRGHDMLSKGDPVLPSSARIAAPRPGSWWSRPSNWWPRPPRSI